MENLNDNFSRLTQEADSFFLLDNPHRSESLEIITRLFNNIDSFQQKSAISVLNEKVFCNFDVKSIDELCKIKDLKLFGEKSTSEITSKKNPLTIQEIRLLSIFLEKGNPKEELKDLQKLVENYEGDLNKIFFLGTPLIYYVIMKDDVSLAKYILPELDFLERMDEFSRPRSRILSFGNLEINKIVLDIALERGLLLENENDMVEMLIMNPHLNNEEKIEFFKYLQEKGFDFNKYPDVNPMTTAISEKNEALFKFFLDDLKVDVNKKEKSSSGITPLYAAIEAKNYECLETLLKAGVDTSTKNCGPNHLLPFEYAMSLNDQRSLELLAQYKAPLPENFSEKKSLSHLSYIKFKRDPGYKEEAKILKTYEKMKSRSDKEIKIKKISHSFSMQGRLSFSDKNKEEMSSLELEGLPGSYKSCKILAKGIEKSVDFLVKNNDMELNGSYEVVKEVLLFTSQNPEHEQLLERFHSGAWTMVDTGYSKHAVMLVLKKDPNGTEPTRVFICNRGAAMVKAVQSFTFDANLLSVETLEKLRRTLKQQNIEDYERVIFEELPKELHFKSGQVEKKMEDFCELEDQTVGNCTYASPEMAGKLITMCDTFEKKGIQGDDILTEGDGLASQLSDEFEEIRRLTRLQHLEEYLDLHEDEKSSYSVDKDFVKKALLVLWSGKTSDLIKKEIVNIEKRFFKMIGESPEAFSLYKIQKCYYQTINYLLEIDDYASF